MGVCVLPSFIEHPTDFTDPLSLWGSTILPQMIPWYVSMIFMFTFAISHLLQDPGAVVDDDADPEWVNDADPKGKGKGKAKDTGRAPPVPKAPAPVSTRSGRTTRSQNSIAPAPPAPSPSPPPAAKISKKKAPEIPTRPIVSKAPITGFSDKHQAKQKAFLASEDFSAFKTLPKVPGHITHQDLERGDALEVRLFPFYYSSSLLIFFLRFLLSVVGAPVFLIKATPPANSSKSECLACSARRQAPVSVPLSILDPSCRPICVFNMSL